MGAEIKRKNVPIYFYYLTIAKQKMPKMVPSTAWIKLLHLFRQCCSMSFPKA